MQLDATQLTHVSTVDELMRFHTRHKLLLMAHSPEAYRALGRMVAGATREDLAQRLGDYRTAFAAAIAEPPTRGRHVNVLQHIVGYFRDVATEQERRHMAAAIADYERSEAPLDTTVTLLAQYARQYGVRYLLDQVYLGSPQSG
ncbi:MAG TPA: YbgA family protein [Vicinamibacterales bacterium]|nr:YbgA family protein [Vicinamibacterales bacterium]